MTDMIARDIDADWVLCTGCATPVFGKRLHRNARVCPECRLHLPLTAAERIAHLADDGRYDPLPLEVASNDPLRFVDTVPYAKRLAQARERTGLNEAVVCARARIGGSPVVLAAMDFRFLGGSLGSAVGELITLAAETALAERTPLLIVTASGGARMQEGALSLMQMAKTSAALGELDRAGILTITLVADPTFGGVAASFATLTDVIVAEPGARLGFAGRRVIEQTIRQQLPPEFQTAEFLLDRGFIDMIVERSRLRQELGRLLRAGARTVPGPAAPPAPDVPDPVVRDSRLLPEPDPWRHVRQARDLSRPTTRDYLALVFDDFQELHGDRVSGQCPAIVGGIAWLDSGPAMVIGQQKGHDPAELTRNNFGMPRPAGYRKAARLMRLADKLGLPVVTLVDTPGAYPGADAEEQGQAVAIAENLRLMAFLSVPVVTVVIGEGGSGGALALAVANRVLMFSRSVYSVISPEGCAAIVWKDPAAAPDAARALGLNSRDLLRLGVVDGVIPEPEGGTGADPLRAADSLGAALRHSLHELSGLSRAQLGADRRARFRQFGSSVTVEAELLTMSEEAY
ncbi:acetyl-CoA carboxylase, carboxyltransferase subunit beta [Krasilnikovia sp. MM14-A1259]|uniref:acetyl-CoA carboxylase, carboxyltransferase subunit beta n=1 Tax=Krasilnikovia sp. MM14-A1259 TaxID=3373539 RepID=UPI003815B4AE